MKWLFLGLTALIFSALLAFPQTDNGICYGESSFGEGISEDAGRLHGL
jgi:hypothetical protein